MLIPKWSFQKKWETQLKMEKKVEMNLGKVGKMVEMNNEDAEKSVNGEKDESTFNDKDYTECVTEETDSY